MRKLDLIQHFFDVSVKYNASCLFTGMFAAPRRLSSQLFSFLAVCARRVCFSVGPSGSPQQGSKFWWARCRASWGQMLRWDGGSRVRPKPQVRQHLMIPSCYPPCPVRVARSIFVAVLPPVAALAVICHPLRLCGCDAAIPGGRAEAPVIISESASAARRGHAACEATNRRH